MNYLKNNLGRTFEFIRQGKHYFRDVLLVHFFIMLIWAPSLVTITRFMLKRGNIPYVSYDNLGYIMMKHPIVFIGLLLMMVLLVVSLYFEFTFLLLSLYFIQTKQPIPLPQLIKGTLSQIKRVKGKDLLLFLFYFILVSPIGGVNFNSELLAKIQIPVFIIDFIFANRILIVSLFVILYVALIYIGIRIIFALPEMILNHKSFRQSLRFSWDVTKGKFLNIFGQFFIVTGSITLISGLLYTLIIGGQFGVEYWWPNYALGAAMVFMTILQVIWVLNLVFSTVGIFFVTINFMSRHHWLPNRLDWYQPMPHRAPSTVLKKSIKGIVIIGVALILVGVTGFSNYEFLSSGSTKQPMTMSHRGVDNKNGVQNTLASLRKTSQETHPDYIEMDIQETKDHQFVVYHDFNLKPMTGVAHKPYELTLDELTDIVIHEDGMEEKLVSFDDYLAEAKQLNQKLLIEIKTTKHDSPELVDWFIERYRDIIFEEGHMIQSLTFDTIEELKEKEPNFKAGYIMPFSVVGPPIGEMDFYAIEYTTLSTSFVRSAQKLGKQVYAWTPNDSDTMNRMMFYGVDGIITDQMSLLNTEVNKQENITYSDKLIYFVIGMG